MRICRFLLVLLLTSCVSARSSRAEDVPSLGKDNGPLVILLRTYRGDDAEVKAQTLASELREEFEMPTYLYRIENQGKVAAIEVVVGDAKNAAACEKLRKQVKKIKPKCLEKERYHKDLSGAIQIRNPMTIGK